MKKVIILIVACLFLAGCADAQQNVTACVTGESYGFLSGIWHGFILGFSVIGRLLSEDIAIYAQNNTGLAYDLGFVLGAGGFGKILRVVISILE